MSSLKMFGTLKRTLNVLIVNKAMIRQVTKRFLVCFSPIFLILHKRKNMNYPFSTKNRFSKALFKLFRKKKLRRFSPLQFILSAFSS